MPLLHPPSFIPTLSFFHLHPKEVLRLCHERVTDIHYVIKIRPFRHPNSPPRRQETRNPTVCMHGHGMHHVERGRKNSPPAGGGGQAHAPFPPLYASFLSGPVLVVDGTFRSSSFVVSLDAACERRCTLVKQCTATDTLAHWRQPPVGVSSTVVAPVRLTLGTLAYQS